MGIHHLDFRHSRAGWDLYTLGRARHVRSQVAKSAAHVQCITEPCKALLSVTFYVIISMLLYLASV